MKSSDKNEVGLRVALVQMSSIDDPSVNLGSMLSALDEVAAVGPCDLVCFPENALFFRIDDGRPMATFALETSAELEALSRAARELGSTLHVGTVPLRESEGGVSSASIVIEPDGRRFVSYRKIHLFDVDVEGQKPIRESDSFVAGREPSVIEVGGFRLGSSVCYDVRFAELFHRYAQQGVDAILVPAAFLARTGQAHWEILLRARAIESQAYVLAAGQGGEHLGVSGGQRSTWGQSMIVDPWGRKLVECAPGLQGVHVIRATLARVEIERVRKQIPMAKHRRL